MRGCVRELRNCTRGSNSQAKSSDVGYLPGHRQARPREEVIKKKIEQRGFNPGTEWPIETKSCFYSVTCDSLIVVGCTLVYRYRALWASFCSDYKLQGTVLENSLNSRYNSNLGYQWIYLNCEFLLFGSMVRSFIHTTTEYVIWIFNNSLNYIKF